MQLSDLVGLIPEEVGETLAAYAEKVPADQAIVEIGSYKGKSTCYLASRAQAHVYAIDAWDLPENVTGRFKFNDAYPDFVSQVQAMGYENRITALKGFGDRVDWHGPLVGLLFVDGNHSARAVEADVHAWLRRMAWKDSVIILDDLDTPRNPGVRRAAEKLSRELGPFRVEASRLAIWTL